MTKDVKQAIIGFTLGAGLLWLLIKAVEKSRADDTPVQPKYTDEDIAVAVTAYQEAMAAGEGQAALAELNEEIKKDYGLTVMFRHSDEKFVVKNLSGREVKIV